MVEPDKLIPQMLVSFVIKSRGLISVVPRLPTTTTRPTCDLSICKSEFKLTFANISITKSTPSPFVVAF